MVVKNANPRVHLPAQIPSTALRTGSLHRARATIRTTIVHRQKAQPLGCAVLISSLRKIRLATA